jgi:AAA15 family ATPase/GTPase
MLIGFSFKNFMSFYDETTFSMRAIKNERFEEINTFKTKYGDLLKSAFIYGANASGKTNVMLAFNEIKKILFADTILQSRLIKNVNILTNFNYLEGAKSAPSSFEVEFIIDNVIYRYGFEVLNGEVNKEFLYKKTKRETPIFVRSSPNCIDIDFTGRDMNNVEDIAKNTRRDNLFLYKAYDNNNELASKIYKWFENILFLTTDDVSNLLSYTIDFLQKDIEGINKILSLLQQADRTIMNFGYKINEGKEGLKINESEDNVEIIDKVDKQLTVELFTDRFLYSENKEKLNTIKRTPGYFESAGTVKTFEIAGPIIKALENGSVVFLDELDSRLHPFMVRFFAELFNSIHNNQFNAQLICTTHDVLLLDEKIRRDQIYFTEKDDCGMSSLYSLCEFKGLRKESKLLKMYLLGAFGAVPKLKEIYLHKKSKGVETNE